MADASGEAGFDFLTGRGVAVTGAEVFGKGIR
jgi:hypothetical protein